MVGSALTWLALSLEMVISALATSPLPGVVMSALAQLAPRPVKGES